MTLTLEQRDELRALVLRAFYDVNEQAAGMVEQTGVIAERIGCLKPDVDRATLYLSERGLLHITDKHGYLGSFEMAIMAEITAYGIDVIERPEKNGPRVLDAAVIHKLTIINGTHVSGETVYHNSQHVGGDNHGVMVNASQTLDIAAPTTPFPLEALRALLPEGTPEREAAEMLESETRSAHPVLSRITTAMETIKATAISAEAVKAVGEWMQKPDVVQWFHHLTAYMLRW
jgi:hypothetical protein